MPLHTNFSLFFLKKLNTLDAFKQTQYICIVVYAIIYFIPANEKC